MSCLENHRSAFRSMVLLALFVGTLPGTGAGAEGKPQAGPQRLATDFSSYARWLLLTDVHQTPAGGVVWFAPGAVHDGPVHTNGRLAFWADPWFGDTVTSADTVAVFHNHGTPRTLADDHNGTIDVPVFARGFQRGAPRVPLPDQLFDQQRAALGFATNGIAPTNPQIRLALGLPPGSTPPPDGIYFPNTACASIGGIYVQGDATQIVASADTVRGLQVYRIVQGAVARTITVDLAANLTTMTCGSNTCIYVGIPRGVLFVNGAVADLGGPERAEGTTPPALLKHLYLLVAATGDIVLARDLVVQDFEQGLGVLGILSGGSVRVAAVAPDDMRLDAFVMALGPTGAFTVDEYDRSPRGTFHLRGGAVARRSGRFGALSASGVLVAGYQRDFHHDTRGLVPPYYPALQMPVLDAPVRAVPAPVTPWLSAEPNPAAGFLRIRYALPRGGRVRIQMLDLQGRRVASLVDELQPAGEYQLSWPGGRSRNGRVPPGVYLLRLETSEARFTSKVVILSPLAR